ncbi:MAG: hypothetical protein PHW18_08915 [Sulfuricurvum sp.]|uniref:hypothetical protein n=1 Tax=Sulfuricurvum sp. TaxID=2025608 RepID=UPI00262E473B|nr:hypothetical protein [Sulfuricurvum sp.]MDD2829679.1 hypothetical protein [Sulfuricurvum sp.]MDD4950121.1 hypothetical protein [Sulfuricurvum sp.]
MQQLRSVISSIIILGACTAQADDGSPRDNLLSLSTTHNSYDISDNNRNAYDLFYNTESVKFSVGGASNLFYTNILYKFDPLNDRKWFVKTEGDYSNQQFPYARLIAYSGVLATGYMIQDDLYVEAGGRITKHDDSTNVTDETIKVMGAHITKRWESTIGTLDTSIGANRTYQKFSDTNYYYGTVNYYPVDNARIGASYSYSDQSISNRFALAYGYLYANYSKDITHDKRNVTLGVQCAFSNVTDFSSYRMPTNIKPHISE